MAQTPEKLILNKITKWMEKTWADELFYFKYHPSIYSPGGIPDLICCIKGKCVGIEVKTSTGKATTLQLRTLEAITSSGGISIIIRGFDTAKLEELKDIVDASFV